MPQTVSQQELERYEEGWTREMMTYWRERMLALEVYDTGRLYNSLKGTLHRSGTATTIEHRFLEYGIFVAAGTGKGYTRGNGGNLEFLKDWRTNRRHRQKRDWFARKYIASIMRLGEYEAAFYGRAYQGLMAENLKEIKI